MGDEIQFAFAKQAFMTSSILVNGKDGELEVCRESAKESQIVCEW